MKSTMLTGCFLAALSPSVFSDTYTGELKVLVVDDFKAKKSTTLYQLHDNNQQYTLELPESVKKEKLLSGLLVTVEGEAVNEVPNEKGLLKSELNNLQNDKKIKVKSMTFKKNLNEIDTNLSKSMLANTDVDTKNRKIVAFLMDFSDKKTTSLVPVNELYSNLYTSDTSMKMNMDLSSFSQINFIPDPNQDGMPDIYKIQLNYPIGNTCDFVKWATDARSVAQALGVDLSLYQHQMIFFPQDAACNWAGMAEVGCLNNNCLSWIKAYKNVSIYSKSVYAHELGHNLGLFHAAIDTNNDGISEGDYSDDSDFMGANINNIKELNAPHRDQMKWFDTHPGSLKTVNQSGSFSLSSLEKGATNDLLTLKIPKPDTSNYYYISYRTNLGPFGSGTTNFLNKVNIHTAADTGMTYFIQALDVNGTFVDKKNQLTFKVLSIDGSRANVQVTFAERSEKIQTVVFFNNDNTGEVGYQDWDFYHWKGNCPPYAEAVGLSTAINKGRPNAIACLIKDRTTSKATGEFARSLGGIKRDQRIYARNGDWDYGYYKWECGLNEYINGFSQHPFSNQLHKIRCAKGEFTNGGQNSCETRFVWSGKDDRGSLLGGDWDPNYYKGQCSDGKLIFGVSLDLKTLMPHKILCCNR